MEQNTERKKYDKVYKSVLFSVFLLFIFSVFVLNTISKDRIFSEQENRKLNAKPEFSINKLLHSKFTSKYEKYVSDQFILRDSLINIKAASEKIIGKKENNDVYLGHDKFLIAKFKKLDKNSISERLKAINTFARENKKLSKYVMLVPNQVKVLSEKLPANAPEKDQLQFVDKVYSGLDKDIKTINVFNTLNEHKNEYIYYKTDHHWTTKGAYYAYKEFCKSAEINSKNESDYDIKKVSNNFYGTLYSRAGVRNIGSDEINVYLPKTNEPTLVNFIDKKKKSASLYNSNSLDGKDKYTVFLGGNDSIVKINTCSNSEKRLLVVKDSYANCFIPFLTAHFDQIIVVDLRYYEDDLKTVIKDYGITDVLILYNVNTFFEDPSILNISNYDDN